MNAIEQIRAVIIDDEEPARNELRYLLEQIPNINIVLEAENSQELLNSMERLHPHIIFIDIEMPKENGLQLSQIIREKNSTCFIVFATAHEEFALKAFDLNAVDYILKPFSLKRISQCITKVLGFIQSAPATGIPVNKNKLPIEHNGKVVLINIDDIISACCEDGQLLIYTNNKIYYSNMALNELQMRLDNRFFRSHRAYLVNTEKISEVIPWFNGTLNLIMDDARHMEIPVSRHQAPKLKQMFGL